MLYENIKTERQELDITIACRLLSVSRNWYQAWLQQPIPTEKPEPLLKSIRLIKNDSDCRKYGYRRVTAELHRKKISANHKKVLKIMHKNDLIVKTKQFRICTTNSNHGLRIYLNLIKNLVVVRLNQVWVADITYIRLANKTHIYLAVIMDRFSRRFLGWQLSFDIDEQLCIDALFMAFEDRKGTDLTGLIHHSDRGVQYAGNQYTEELKKRGILISMSAKGNPYDNAHIESAIKTIKCEEVYMDEYETFEDAHQNLKHFIEKVYNKKRLNSAIGYLPPAEFEQKILKEVVA